VRINWGVAITIVYITFATATVSFVVFAVGRPVELVSADYYEQSLKHDAHRRAMANAEALGDAVRIAAVEDAAEDAAGDARTIAISIATPTAQTRALPVTGTVTLYRPSDQTGDRVTALSLDDEGHQRIRVESAARGRWVVKLAWRAGRQDFYREQTVWLR
jgi:hypothetical protein